MTYLHICNTIHTLNIHISPQAVHISERRFYFFTVMKIQVVVLWVVTPCSDTENGGGKSSERLVSCCFTRRRHKSGDRDLNLISQFVLSYEMINLAWSEEIKLPSDRGDSYIKS
jgi:hypothetical protein